MIITKNISIIIFLAIFLGFIWPEPGLFLKSYLIYLLMIMMFFSCLKINVKDLKDVPENWWRYLILMMVVFILPSSIIYFLRFWFQDMVFVGLIIAAAMPAGISIVFLSDLIGGEPTKALVITTLSHVLSPIITPIIIWFFAHKVVNIDFIAMLILIGELVLVPLISAQIIKRYKNFEKLEKNSSNLNLVLLFLLIWSTLAIARNSILYNIDQFIISSIVILFLLFLTIIFSIWFGRNRKEDITWAVAGTYKNFTLASVIALTMFGPVAMVGAAVYNVLDNILLVPIKWLAAKYNRPEKK